MRETRKQKMARQQAYAVDRVMDGIRKAIDSGELVITPMPVDAVDPHVTDTGKPSTREESS